MPVILTRSPKGGVGKTTLTANLAIGLRSLGWTVYAVDLDPQNSLRFHLNLPVTDEAGWAERMLASRPWDEAIEINPQGVRVVPFGAVPADRLEALERQVGSRGLPMMTELQRRAGEPDTMVVVDTLPGYSSFQRAAHQVADLSVVILLADAASFAVAPALTRRSRSDAAAAGAERATPTVYVANQYNAERRLSRDVRAAMAQVLGPRLIGTIRDDPSVAEAVACRTCVLLHDVGCGASADLIQLALWLDGHFDDVEQAPPSAASA